MDDATIPNHNNDLQEMRSRFGAPAYVRRARQVQDAFEALVQQGRVQREERLAMVRLRLGQLHALAGGWDALRPLLADEEHLEVLRRLHAELAPRLRVAVEPTASVGALRQALRELQQSITRFNLRWHAFLAGLDLREINDLRDGYNRYYLLEKECALRSPRLARLGYRPLDAATPEELEALLPLLPVPRGQGTS